MRNPCERIPRLIIHRYELSKILRPDHPEQEKLRPGQGRHHGATKGRRDDPSSADQTIRATLKEGPSSVDRTASFNEPCLTVNSDEESFVGMSLSDAAATSAPDTPSCNPCNNGQPRDTSKQQHIRKALQSSHLKSIISINDSSSIMTMPIPEHSDEDDTDDDVDADDDVDDRHREYDDIEAAGHGISDMTCMESCSDGTRDADDSPTRVINAPQRSTIVSEGYTKGAEVSDLTIHNNENSDDETLVSV